jgi:aerobic-type carbon monoxide dehydrogenase small subunit (CoxS/CutS family)
VTQALLEPLIEVSMTVDGTTVAATVRPRYLLSDFLREQARIGGVHVACGQGICGACTVAVDGVPVRACLMLAVQADGAAVQSIASLPALEGCNIGPGDLTPLQAAFRQHHALQCGFCTPGLLVSTALFLADRRQRSGRPAPGSPAARAEILDHLNGHLCRCTGYANIIAAIEAVLA